MGINIKAVKDQIMATSSELAGKVKREGTENLFDSNFKFWNPELVISLNLLSLSISNYLLSGNELVVDFKGKMTKEKAEEIAGRATDIAASYFYRYSDFGSKNIYSAKFISFMESNEKVNSFFTTFLSSISRNHYVENIEALYDIATNAGKLDLKSLREDGIDTNLFVYFSKEYIKRLELFKKRIEVGDKQVAPIALMFLKSSFVKIKCGVGGISNVDFSDIREIMESSEIFDAIKEFDNLAKAQRLVFDENDCEIYFGYLLLYLFYNVLRLNKKEFTEFTGITNKYAIDDNTTFTVDPELVYDEMTELPIRDGLEMSLLETVREVDITLKRIETRSYGGSGSSSSSSDDDDISPWTVVATIAGVAAVGYIGAVGYSYFTGESTLGEAIDNVNGKIADTLGFGDGIRTIN